MVFSRAGSWWFKPYPPSQCSSSQLFPPGFPLFPIALSLLHRSLWYVTGWCSLFGNLQSSKAEGTWYQLGSLFTSEKAEGKREVTCLMSLEKLVSVVKSKLGSPDPYPKLPTDTSTHIRFSPTCPDCYRKQKGDVKVMWNSGMAISIHLIIKKLNPRGKHRRGKGMGNSIRPPL